MNKLELNTTISQGSLFKEEWKEKVDQFKSKNIGKKVQITLEIIDSPLHYLFRYYHGFLLPDIAETLGESSQVYVDKMILKRQFLMVKIDNDFSRIDKRHKSGNQYFTEQRLYQGIEHDYVIGYTPSKACITHEEMKKFIQDCENFLFNFLGGCIDEKHQDQAESIRKNGMIR